MVKNLPAMWETHFQSLGWEDPVDNGMATHCSILAWRISWIEAMVHEITESWTQLKDILSYKIKRYKMWLLKYKTWWR